MLDGYWIDVVRPVRPGRQFHHNRPGKQDRCRNATAYTKPGLTADHARPEHRPSFRYAASAEPSFSGYISRAAHTRPCRHCLNAAVASRKLFAGSAPATDIPQKPGVVRPG